VVQNIAEKFNCLSSVQLCISINQIYWKSAKKFSTNPANRQTDKQSNMDKKKHKTSRQSWWKLVKNTMLVYSGLCDFNMAPVTPYGHIE